ncbi:hypothetical protein [Haliangium sp.]|uniref:hypothetical protein n=1 Tax=Haliangium sp. TaxID=2663208 RepID=UPI003D0B9BB3
MPPSRDSLRRALFRPFDGVGLAPYCAVPALVPHHTANDCRARGYSEVAVHAQARVSFNGGPVRIMGDPDVDRGQVHGDLSRKSRLLLPPTELPIQLRASQMRAERV